MKKITFTITILLFLILSTNYLEAASFGIKTLGSSSGTCIDQMKGKVLTTPSDMGTVNSISFGISSSGTRGDLKGFIVSSTTKQILYISDTVGYPTGSWATTTFSSPPTLSPNTNYIFMSMCSGTGTDNVRFTAGTGGQSLTDTSNSFTTPTDPTDGTLISNIYTVYVTYTPSGGTTANLGTWYISEEW